MAKRMWRAVESCMMPGRPGFFRSGQTIELEDEEVTDRHRALFECLTKDEEDKVKEAARDAADPDLKVMRDRLKNAKVSIPRGATREMIIELFNKMATAENIVASP